MQQSLLLVGLLAIFAQVYIVDYWNPNTSAEMAARQGLLNARKGDSSEGPYVVCPAWFARILILCATDGCLQR